MNPQIIKPFGQIGAPFGTPFDAQLMKLLSLSTNAGKDLANVIDPTTGKNINIPTILGIVGSYIQKNEEKFKPFEPRTDLPQNVPSLPLVYKPDEPPTNFQIEVQKFIRNLPFEYQLAQLNKIQKDCPFIITDPYLRKFDQTSIVGAKPFEYGYADLYRFLGLNIVPGGIHKHSGMPSTKFLRIPPTYQEYHPKLPPGFRGNYYAFESKPLDVNPLFHPVDYNYDIPDVSGNEVLMRIKQESPAELFKKLKGIYTRILPMTSMGAVGITGQILGGGYDKISADVSDIVKLMEYIVKKQSDPNYVLSSVFGAEKPMRKYFKSNFENLLFQLVTSHGVYQFDKKNPEKSVRISSDVKDYVENEIDYYEKNPSKFETRKKSFKQSKPQTSTKFRSRDRR